MSQARSIPHNRWRLILERLVTREWRLGTPLLVGLSALAVFAAVSLALQTAYRDRVTAGVHVLGADVGGRPRAEARSLLAVEVSRMLERPIVLSAQGEEWSLNAAELGASLDPDVLVAEAFGVGREGNPLARTVAQWQALIFGQQVRGPVPEFDSQKLESQLSVIAQQVDRPTRDAHLEFSPSGNSVAVSIATESSGTRLLVADSARRVRQAVATGLPARAELVTSVQPPSATSVDFESARVQAERMLSGPLAVTYQTKRWVISAATLTRFIDVTRGPGQPAQVAIDVDAARAAFTQIAAEVERPGVNARFELAGGNLRVIRESQDGTTLDLEALQGGLRERLLSGDRTYALPVAVARPAVASSDGPGLGIKELVREGRTSFPGSVPEKQANIRLASARLNGVVVPPGELFSFNREVGPTTLDAGFRTGWGITGTGEGARTVPAVAGGICQVATTLFQPVFHAGYAIEQRNWHLYWINSYGQPPLGMRGLDATVDEDAGLDLQFINNTPDYLLVQSRVEGTTLVFGLYGTRPSWNVNIEGPVITNVVPASREQVTQDEPSMPAGRTLAVESAQDGYDVTVTRTVKQGDDVRTLRLRSHYVPSRNVTLIGTGPA